MPITVNIASLAWAQLTRGDKQWIVENATAISDIRNSTKWSFPDLSTAQGALDRFDGVDRDGLAKVEKQALRRVVDQLRASIRLAEMLS